MKKYKNIKKILYIILPLMGLTLFGGCGENGNRDKSSINTAQGVKLNISLNQDRRKNNPNKFQKIADVSMVTLDVKKNGEFFIQGKELKKEGAKWTTNLNLDISLGSFTFIAKAFNANDLINPIYMGQVSQDIGIEADINISLSPTTPLILERPPFIKDISRQTNQQGMDFNFTVVNYQQNDLNYIIEPKVQMPISCTNPFTPHAGIVNFPLSKENMFNSLFVSNSNLSCQTDEYVVKLFNSKGDTIINTPFKLVGNEVVINFPPEIRQLIIDDNGIGFTLFADAFDPDGTDPVNYEWSVESDNIFVVGETNRQTLILDGYTGVGAIFITLKVYDVGGASLKKEYMLRGNPTLNPNVIPNLGPSYLIQTGQTISYENLDDGDYKKGRARGFTKNTATSTVTDLAQNLMWEDGVVLTTRIRNWNDANNICKEMLLGDYNNWRLPTIQELVNLSDKSKYQPALPVEFTYSGLQDANRRNAQAWYWSSTEEYYNPTDKAWIMYEDTGHIAWSAKANTQYVRCVRDIN